MLKAVLYIVNMHDRCQHCMIIYISFFIINIHVSTIRMIIDKKLIYSECTITFNYNELLHVVVCYSSQSASLLLIGCQVGLCAV